LQKGQLKTVASFSWLFLGGGLAADFLFPILRIGARRQKVFGGAGEAKTHRSVRYRWEKEELVPWAGGKRYMQRREKKRVVSKQTDKL
jgi:hypothetical protein